MRFRCAHLAIAAALASLLSAVCFAQTTRQLDYETRNIGVTERIGDSIPTQLQFTDDNNRNVRISQYIKPGRPLLITLNYADCPQLCSLQLTDLAKALRDMDWTPGDEFVLLTVSVNPEETYKRAKQSKLRYLGITGKSDIDKGWHFLTTETEKDIYELADALGFKYWYDTETGEYRHKAAMFVINGDGVISHYLRNMAYDPNDLRNKLESSANGELGEPNQDDTGFGLNCFTYEYTDNMARAFTWMRYGGVGILVFVVSFVGYWWIREFRLASARKKEDGQLQPEAT